MSYQRIGPKKLRKLEVLVGEPLLFAVAAGGYTYEFVTAKDEHGWYDMKTETWGWHIPADHFASCVEIGR